MKNNFPKNLKYLRNIFGMTQEDVSKIVEKERSLIGHWESGNREPTVDDIIKLSNHFKIPMHDLIEKNLSSNPMTDEEQEQWSKNMFENKNAKILFDKINEHKNLTYEDAQKIADLIDIITKDYNDNHE